MNKLSIQDLSLKDQKVLMRVDFNVPLTDDLTIADDTRIKASLPSIEYVLAKGASLILMSHLGRPKGAQNSKYSLKPIAQRLSELLNLEVKFAPHSLEPSQEMAKELKPKEILLLENLRFYDAEEHPEKDPSFAEKLASMGDLYINDAFGTAHRKHSSTYLLPKFFPEKAAAGFLMEKEIAFLGNVIKSPKRPFYAIVGGAKISTKIGVLKALTEKVDAIFLGGGMTYTFLKANGLDIGDSLFEAEQVDSAKELIKETQNKAVKLFLPEDITIADSYNNEAKTKVISTKESIPDGWQGLDIGPKTIQEWKKILKKAGTLFWNGPLGVFEMSSFSTGTNEIAKTLAESPATTIIGGGDSLFAINKLNLNNQFTHLSTGGGACMEFIEFGQLPGIDALTDR